MNPDILLGTKVGNIRIAQVIGQGAMGTVYAGHDEKLDRKVALKVMRKDRPGYARNRARFLREARILSRLDHPNICGIHDFIEHEDNDFLVLELVAGQQLHRALKRGLDRAGKLSLVQQLVDALVTAHLEGVVHRDLKPDNILVEEDGSLKVLDFGLGRFLDEELKSTVNLGFDDDGDPVSLDQELSTREASDLETRLGRIMGTPGYMSPEQARGEPVTTASDMYSLGLICQEILTERPPLDTGLDRVSLLRKSARGESLPFTDRDPHLESLVNRLKNPAHAARPSALDTREKLLWILDKPKRRTRRRLRLAAAAIFTVFLAIITVQTLRVGAEANRASREASRANREAQVAQKVSDFLVNLFEVSDPGETRGSTVTARELLDRGAEKIRDELEDQPLLQARLLDTIGGVYYSLGLFEEGVDLLNDAITIWRSESGEEGLELAQSLSKLGTMHWQVGDYATARQHHEQALFVREKILGPEHHDFASSLQNLGNIFMTIGDFTNALSYHEKAREIREKVLSPTHPHLANSFNSIGAIHFLQGEYDQALVNWTRSLQIREEVLPEDHPHTIQTMNNLALVYSAQGEIEKAKQLLERVVASQERVLGLAHPDLAAGVNNLGEQHYYLGDYEQAQALFERAVAIQEDAVGAEHPEVARSLFNLARTHHALGRLPEARKLYERTLSIREAAIRPDHPDIAFSAFGLANCLRDGGDYDQAEALYLRALSVFEEGQDQIHPEAASCMRDYARLLSATQRLSEADHWITQAKAIEGNQGGDPLASK